MPPKQDSKRGIQPRTESSKSIKLFVLIINSFCCDTFLILFIHMKLICLNNNLKQFFFIKFFLIITLQSANAMQLLILLNMNMLELMFSRRINFFTFALLDFFALFLICSFAFAFAFSFSLKNSNYLAFNFYFEISLSSGFH